MGDSECGLNCYRAFPSRLSLILAESILLLLQGAEPDLATGKNLTPSKAGKMDPDSEAFSVMEENCGFFPLVNY